ncbi:hypothetical protein HMPREF9213_1377 [Lactobacillus iners LactinV 09V1-c]|nr:hypothetical protein HMPREF9213_1377 [Lactobacillus iners LactinV 09V1-c]
MVAQAVVIMAMIAIKADVIIYFIFSLNLISPSLTGISLLYYM